MKYDICHASKDFIRESGLLIDSLIYSETKAMKNAEQGNVFRLFCAMIIPLLKTGEEMTESVLFLSSYEPLITIAEKAQNELFSIRESLKKNDYSVFSDDERKSFAEKAEKILKRLWDDLFSSDISERLCCDYLRYMICILEGAVRLCGCVSEYEKSEDLLILERSAEMRCRELIHGMKSLLYLIK